MSGGSTLVMFDATPSIGGTYGQIIVYQHDPDAVFFAAPSLGAFLERSNALFAEQGRLLLDGGPWPREPFVDGMSPTRTDRCVCAEYRDPPRTIPALWERVTYSPEIMASLKRVAHHVDRALFLYRCVACGSYWQGSGGEDRRAARVVEVPDIEPDEWLREPYQEAWALALYTSTYDAWANGQLPGTELCRVPGCERTRVRFSLECLEHELEDLRRGGKLIPPHGRRWL
jgi:hypothetical protein